MRTKKTRLLVAKNTIIKWVGDLDDDCFADWAGLKLHAGWMNNDDGLDSWWWVVNDVEGSKEYVASSNDADEFFRSGRAAREAAQFAAIRYLKKS